MKNKKVIFLIFFLAVLFFALCPHAHEAKALECDDTSATICIPSSDDTGLPDPGGIDVILKNFVEWILEIFGAIAILGLVISGVQYITASGSEKVIETAKRNMTYSIIGIIVALASFVIVQAIDSALNAFSTF